MSTKRVKARSAYWIEYGKLCIKGYFLPADAASYEKMVEQLELANMRRPFGQTYTQQARAALRAIGIVPPKQPKKGTT